MQSKKSLGQHFLTSRGALQAIVKAGNIAPTDTILEIGPGTGVLTTELLKVASHVIAVEKDAALIPVLESKYSSALKAGKLTLIHQDIMEYEPTGDYKLIANIPYYLTGAILEKFLSTTEQPNTIVFLVQKEVAERLVARATGSGQAKDLKESILSISVKAYGEPKYIQTVKAGSFNPPPKVDSAIIAITNISKKHFHNAKVSEEAFFTIVKAGFAHKRKTIGNNLRALGFTTETLAANNLKSNDRAEDLTIDDWFRLAQTSI